MLLILNRSTNVTTNLQKPQDSLPFYFIQRHAGKGSAICGFCRFVVTLDEIERQTILQALEQHKGNLSQVALALGISRAALYRRLEKYKIAISD